MSGANALNDLIAVKGRVFAIAGGTPVVFDPAKDQWTRRARRNAVRIRSRDARGEPPHPAGLRDDLQQRSREAGWKDLGPIFKRHLPDRHGKLSYFSGRAGAGAHYGWFRHGLHWNLLRLRILVVPVHIPLILRRRDRIFRYLDGRNIGSVGQLGFRCILPFGDSSNDGGLSLGQAVIANARIGN